MTEASGEGSMHIGPLVMKQFEKKFFDTYSEAEIWLLNSGSNEVETDGVFRKEAGRWFFFVRNNEEKPEQDGD